jgi:HPt (histidine-containing phosphotransfer) domain-containing protein
MLTDLTYLQQMTGNDSEQMKEMINLFLNQLAETQVNFESVIDNKNWLELSRLAHKIKSSALVMGVGQMADEMKELELLAKESRSTEKYPEYVARFKTMTNITVEELKPYLDSGK